MLIIMGYSGGGTSRGRPYSDTIIVNMIIVICFIIIIRIVRTPAIVDYLLPRDVSPVQMTVLIILVIYQKLVVH